MHYFTSITTNYLPKARVLAQTLKLHNPNAVMHVIISDDLPVNFNISQEDFDFVYFAEDILPKKNLKRWLFSHTVVELCTAVKGIGALHILEKTHTDKIIYLDPDIAVFGSLDTLSDMLDVASILLTPHQTALALNYTDIQDDEICSLAHGVYNFGFFAVKADEEGLKFLNWWSNRLILFCYDDIPRGLFTDQRWGDLIPALFDNVKIIKDPEYNVATWNLSARELKGNIDKGVTVNGRPLKFFHFTGYDSGAHIIQLARHGKEGDDLFNLSHWYEAQIKLKGQDELGKVEYKYARYTDGTLILKEHRVCFRNRLDVYKHFENPFLLDYYLWYNDNFKRIQVGPPKETLKKNLKKIGLFEITKKIVNTLRSKN